MSESEKEATKLEEILQRLAVQVGILGKVILDLPRDDPNQRSLQSALTTSCLAIKSLEPKTALERIVQGFAMAHGDFKKTIALFEMLDRNGLPKNFAPSFHLVGLSESPKEEIGFVFREERLKLVPHNENAKWVVSKLLQIVREKVKTK